MFKYRQLNKIKIDSKDCKYNIWLPDYEILVTFKYIIKQYIGQRLNY